MDSPGVPPEYHDHLRPPDAAAGSLEPIKPSCDVALQRNALACPARTGRSRRGRPRQVLGPPLIEGKPLIGALADLMVLQVAEPHDIQKEVIQAAVERVPKGVRKFMLTRLKAAGPCASPHPRRPLHPNPR